MIQSETPLVATPRTPVLDLDALEARVRDVAGDDALKVWRAEGQPRPQVVLDIPGASIAAVVERLKQDEELGFRFLSDLTAADYLSHPDRAEMPERFAVMLFLRNLQRNLELRVRAFVNEDNPRIPTLSGLFRGAIWQEREVFDLFGIDFQGHPDMKRIIMPEDYEGHPLRKDYPLRGRGERSNFPMVRPDDIRVLKD